MTLNDTSEYTSPCVSMVYVKTPWFWPDRGDLSVRLVTKEVPVVLQAIHDNIVEVPQVEYIEVVKEIWINWRGAELIKKDASLRTFTSWLPPS